MKKLIEENYSIKAENFVECDKYGYCLIDGDYYYLVTTAFTPEEISNILLLLSSIESPLLSHQLIVNNRGSLLTDGYVLLKINGILEENYKVTDIIKFNHTELDGEKLKKIKVADWKTLWMEKLDFFEYQIREIGKDKKVILDSFSYYLGLAENACTYIDKVVGSGLNAEQEKMTLSHRRVYYPNYKLNFLNPLNYTLDLEVRDIAEYLKNMFFATDEDEVWNEVQEYFQSNQLSAFSYHMFYARMLYPSYYFDAYEDVMVDGNNEDILIKYIEKIEAYEHFLDKLKKYLARYVQIFDIEWLNKS